MLTNGRKKELDMLVAEAIRISLITNGSYDTIITLVKKGQKSIGKQLSKEDIEYCKATKDIQLAALDNLSKAKLGMPGYENFNVNSNNTTNNTNNNVGAGPAPSVKVPTEDQVKGTTSMVRKPTTKEVNFNISKFLNDVDKNPNVVVGAVKKVVRDTIMDRTESYLKKNSDYYKETGKLDNFSQAMLGLVRDIF